MLWHQQLAMMMKNLEQNKKKQLSIAQKKNESGLNIELDTKLPYILEIQHILKNIEKRKI